MGVTGDLLSRIIHTAGRKVDLASYKDGIMDRDRRKRQRTRRRPLKIGLDVGSLVARAAHGFGSMLLDERYLTNYGRCLLQNEAAAGEDARQQMTTEENRREYVNRCAGYVMKRITVLREKSCGQLMVVFDGDTPPIKEQECRERSQKRKEAERERDEPLDRDEEARVNAKRRLRAARRAGAGKNHGDIVIEVMQALRREQVPFMVAPYEADGQLAYFANKGMIDLVVTEDSDLIAHGCPSLLYKTAEELGNGQATGILVQRGDLGCMGLVPKCLSLVDWSDVMLAVMFVAVGCDYCSSLKQIGSVAARDIVKECFQGSKRQSEEERAKPALEKVFEKLYAKTTEKDLTYEFKKDYEASFLAALLMYRHPMIYDPFQGKCVLLRNPPEGSDPELMDYKPYADLCRDKRRREEILGTCPGPVLSKRIAEGWVNPRTKRPYENMELPPDGQETSQLPVVERAESPAEEPETQNDFLVDEEEAKFESQDISSVPAIERAESAAEAPETQNDFYDVEEEAKVETHETQSAPGSERAESDTEGPETQDNYHAETQLDMQTPTRDQPETQRIQDDSVGGTQSMASTPNRAAETEGPETQDYLHAETQLESQAFPAGQEDSQTEERMDGTSNGDGGDRRASDSDHVFTLTFTSELLGVKMAKRGENDRHVRVDHVYASCEHEKSLKIGDAINAINGRFVGNDDLDDIVRRIMNFSRPIEITFSRTGSEDNDGRVDNSGRSNAAIDFAQFVSPVRGTARTTGRGDMMSSTRSPAVETTQTTTSSSSATRLGSQPSQPSTGSQISVEVLSPDLLSSQPS